MPEKITTPPRGPERDKLSPATDPVCGMTVNPSSAAAKFDWRGKTYHFCAIHCQLAFAKDPDKYLGPQPPVDQTRSSSTAAAKYTCPMHPEVSSTRPGDCPQCGMALMPSFHDGNGESEHLTFVKRHLIWSAAFAVPLFLFSMSQMSHHISTPIMSAWLELGMASPVVLWLALPFFQKGLASIKNRNLNMFTLLSLGIGVPYLYSALTLLFATIHIHAPSLSNPQNTYFESAAVIATLAWLGQYFEAKAHIQSTGSIANLLSLAPSKASLLNDDGTTCSIDVLEITAGASLLVRPGERIPVDGTVIDGEGVVDESMLTGESIPATKSAGSKVSAGSLNLDGSLKIKAEKVGKETTLAQIVDLVNEAQRSKVPAQQMADKVSAIFVPSVMAISLITLIGWTLFGVAIDQAFSMSMAVLLVACPCALGLATPMSIIVASGRGASAGVLFKSAATLESLSRIDILVIDKTGTLTNGSPVVHRVQSLGERSPDELLALASSLESQSEHPLAKSIVAEARAKALTISPCSSFRSTSGLGVRGIVDGREVAVGQRKFLQVDEQILNSEKFTAETSTVLITIEGKLQGYIELKDTPRERVKESIASLRDRDIQIVLASGDNLKAVESIAIECGITHFHHSLLPIDKEELVANFQRSGKTVAMLGDGINDAPALAKADIGIALSTGTDIAVDTADIVLIKGDIAAAVRAFNLSKAMVTNISENLFLAFAYNIVAIPVAAGAFLPLFGLTLDPMVAAIGMSLSSILVIVNSSRLKQAKL